MKGIARLTIALLCLLVVLVPVGAGGGPEADPDSPPGGTPGRVTPGAGGFGAAGPSAVGAGGLVGLDGRRFPSAPEVPEGPLAAGARAAMDRIADRLPLSVDREAVAELGASGDPRVLWFLTDLFRFSRSADFVAIEDAFEDLTGVDLVGGRINEIPDHLIAWDLPAHPGYREIKGRVLTIIEPAWQPFFDDEDSAIDWRLVGWGGVLIDDRPDASPGVPCNRCIPAIDDPPVTDAKSGAWYPDDAIVFGVVINGEARAYPKNIMEVHEMVNDSLGGRRFGMPYCTLCGSAQAYYTDDVPGFSPILRTSGLLSRSNKFMYDVSTFSAVDTFTGRAISGPLHEAGVELNQIPVVTSTWGAWMRAYPDTTILASDAGTPGRRYPMDPLRGRDDDGPIFPVGDVDPRLPVQERVLGVIAPDGTPMAFPVANAALALQAGDEVSSRGVVLEQVGSGLRARVDGEVWVGHEAFWFAWSQFHPSTEIWRR